MSIAEFAYNYHVDEYAERVAIERAHDPHAHPPIALELRIAALTEIHHPDRRRARAEQAAAAQREAAIAAALAGHIPGSMPSVETVIALCCIVSDCEPDEVFSPARERRISTPRAIIAAALRRTRRMSYPEIAAAIHRKNHSTVISAANRAKREHADKLQDVLTLLGFPPSVTPSKPAESASVAPMAAAGQTTEAA